MDVHGGVHSGGCPPVWGCTWGVHGWACGLVEGVVLGRMPRYLPGRCVLSVCECYVVGCERECEWGV